MKKIILYFLILLCTIAFLELFGGYILKSLSDVFQKNICMKDICIHKPKGWIPQLVREGNATYVLGIIDGKYIPGFSKIKSPLSKKADGILLGKENKFIQINSVDMSNLNTSKMKSLKIGSHQCYLAMSTTPIVCPRLKLLIMMDRLEMSILEEILQGQ